MFLEKIEIEKFRNINSAVYYPGQNINFIIGKNAQGKTNFLEAIYFLAYGKSFRTNKINYLFNNENFFNLNTILKKNKVSYIINMKIKEKEKKIKINNKYEKIRDVSDKLKVILYFPGEINFLLKSPALRRNLLDKAIFLHDVNYLDIHLDYIKCLKNRNLCLKENKDDYIWREKLIELSYAIVKKRKKYITEINRLLENNVQNFEKEIYNIKYSSINLENYMNIMRMDFEKIRNTEEKVGYTLLGQHTDAVTFQINDKNIDNYGSEGQKKTFLLLYKYAQLLNFNKHKEFKPILLVDDISSEIDNTREKILIDKLLSNCDQSFITSLNKPSFSFEKANFFHINNGKITVK